MKRLVLVFCFAFSCSIIASPIVIPIAPEGDGHTHRARYGFFDTWNDYAFDSEANPNIAIHDYDSSSAWGEIRRVYMQVALADLHDLPESYDVTTASLNLYITQISGNGSSIHHRTDSSAATGLADQQLDGDVQVMDLTTAEVDPGWLAIDVTDYIIQDLANEHDWAVFHFPQKSNSSLRFASANDTDGYEPYLSVTVIPEPTSMAGLLILLTIAMTRRSRKATDNV